MRRSLGARLTTWYAATSFLLVTATGVIQYRALVTNLAAEDDQTLLETLAKTRAVAPEQAYPGGPHVRMLDVRCRPLSAAPDRSFPPATCSGGGNKPAFRNWTGPDGRSWRVATVPVPGGWRQAILDRSTDQSVLRRYRVVLLAVLGGALLVAVLLGLWIARRGLAPLARLAERMAAIDARSIDRRLGAVGVTGEIQAVAAAFDAMLARLETAFTSLGQVSADLAHEFRTPLHVLGQQAEVALSRARTPEEYREVLSSVLEEVGRLRRMVDDMLFLARAEDPRAAIERVLLDLAAEIGDIIDYLEAVASERQVSLRMEAPATLQLRADRMLLRRALVNLVTNAIRHTPAGGDVTVAAREAGDGVLVTVSDTGEGIAPDEVARAFDRHFRGDGARALRPEGTGLGLSIVRGIMQLHGGTAAIESSTAEGTRVTLTFPSST